MAWVEPKGGKWRGVYRDINGRRRSLPAVKSKREAKNAANAEEQKIRDGIWHDPSAGRMPFSQYFEEHWLPNRVAELNTIAGYESHYNSSLRAAFGETSVNRIRGPVVQRWVVQLEKAGVRPGTIAAKYRTLATVLGARKGVSAVRDGLITKSPCEGITLPAPDPRVIHTYTVTEVDRLMEHIDQWWQPLVMLAAASGGRWGAMMGLGVSHLSKAGVLDLSRVLLELTKAKTGNGTPFVYKPRPKGGRAHSVAIDEESATLVRAMTKARRLFPGDRLFSMPGDDGLPRRTAEWPEGLPIGRSYFRQSIWLPAHDAAGVDPRRFHDLKGSHISWLLAGGADLLTVMERADHNDLATTKLYVEAMKDKDRRALDALEQTRRRERGAEEA